MDKAIMNHLEADMRRRLIEKIDEARTELAHARETENYTLITLALLKLDWFGYIRFGIPGYDGTQESIDRVIKPNFPKEG